MRLFKKITLILTLLAVIFTGWAAVYAYDKGFTKKWRRLVNNEFQKYGIEASIGKLTLDPFQGLVARDVKFFENASRTTLLAAVSRVTLDVDLIRLLEKEFFLNSIEIRNANLSLPVDPDNADSDRIEIQRFNARILMPENRIEISQAHGNLEGIDVAVRGSLFKPAKESPASPERFLKTRQILDVFIKEMERLDLPRKNLPHVSIELAGDMDEIENLRARVRITARNLEVRNYTCRDLNALIELANSRISLKELFVKDDAGELVAQGEHILGTDRIQFKVQSSINFHALASALSTNPALGEIVFYDPPKIYLEGDVLLDGGPFTKTSWPLKCIGSVQYGTFASRGVIFSRLESDFSINRDQFFCRNIKIGHQSGTLTANGIYNPDGLRYNAVIKLDPTIFIPFSKSEGTRKFLSKIKLNEDSSLYMNVHGSGPMFLMNTWHSFGELDVRNIHYNGVAISHLQTELEIDRRQQYYRNPRVKRAEGSVSADLVSFNLDTKITTFHNASGTDFPEKLTQCVSPQIARSLMQYRFKQPPLVSFSGALDAIARSATDFNVKFTANGPIEYDFLGKTLAFDKGVASLHFIGRDVHKAHVSGEIFGGKLTTDFSVKDIGGAQSYTAQVDVKSLSFNDLAARYGYHQDTEGELTGYFNFTGSGVDRKSIDGKGVAILVNGDVFAIPILGPLSKLISGVVAEKNAGYSVAREASANFTMKDGVLATSDFEALAPAFRLRGSGTVDINNDEIDFDARLNARGAPGLLLLPVSKLLEYSAEGSLNNPVWRPKIISSPSNSAAPSSSPKSEDKPKLPFFKLKSKTNNGNPNSR